MFYIRPDVQFNNSNMFQRGSTCFNHLWPEWDSFMRFMRFMLANTAVLLCHQQNGKTACLNWVWVNTYRYIFSGMNIHLPAILGFTRYQGFDPSPTHSGCWRRLGSRPAWKPFGRSRLGGLVEHPIVKGLLISSKIPSGNLTVCY
jgi:hypothetical protein